MSILQKLLNKNLEFQNTLETIYLQVLSTKGGKNSSTTKSMLNYLIALTIHNPSKCDKVLEYFKENSSSQDFLIFFEAINEIRIKKKHDDGI